MNKLYFAAILAFAVSTGMNAQPGNRGFGPRPQINVTFNEYVPAPASFDQ